MAVREHGEKWVSFSKLLVSIGLVFASIYIGDSINNFMWANLTNKSGSVAQVVGAIEFLPMLIAISLVARYAARFTMAIPLSEEETIYRFEASAVRGIISAFVLIFGGLWWMSQIITTDMFAHPIFSWATPIVVVGCWLTSWYHSKRGLYRGAIAETEQANRQTLVHLPSIIGVLGGLLQGKIEVEKIGIERGLPVLLFKISPEEQSGYVLDFGLDRLFPTTLVTKEPKESENSGQEESLSNLRHSLRREIQKLPEKRIESMDYRDTQRIQELAPKTVYEQNTTLIESLSEEEVEAVHRYYDELFEFEEYIYAYSQRKGGGNLQRQSKPLIEAKDRAIAALDRHLEE